MPGSLIMKPDLLCRVCQTLDLNKLVKHSMETPWKVWQLFSSSGPFEELGKFRDVKRRALSCPFCRLVVESIFAIQDSTGEPLPHNTDTIELRNRPSWKMCILIFNFNGTDSKVFSNRADLEREAKALRARGRPEAQRILISWPKCGALGQIQCLANRRRPIDDTFFGRAICPERLDWVLLRWWLRQCKMCHGTSCYDKDAHRARYRLHSNMRVIDVKTHCVVPYRPDWEYVALTYVWGEHLMRQKMPRMSKERFFSRGSDDEHIPLPIWLPKTVSDAIEVVNLLGYRYLWVDALCIVQDDDQDRHSQLLRMDAIYRNASLSIAAASGDHADCGLPGMSTPRKFEQQSETIRSLELAVPLPRFDELNAKDTLKWNTRAWTFQEKVLSRRLLIFTDYQVYFRCSNGVWSEDTAAETYRLASTDGKTSFAWGTHKLPHDHSTRRAYSLVDFLTFGSLKLAKTEAQGSFTNYAAVTEEYTQRTLTYQQDSLAAIDGVLRILDPSPSAYVGGLPRKFFHAAMLWNPELGTKAIEMTGTGAPSWSWARWSLPDGCYWQNRDITDTKGAPPSMIYWTNDSSRPRLISSADKIDNLKVHIPPIRNALEKSGFLLGWSAKIAVFSLGKRIYDYDSRAVDSTVTACDLRLSPESQVIGELVTTSGIFEKSPLDRRFEFVELSTGTELRFVGPLIPKELQPTTTKKIYVPGAPVTIDEYTTTRSEGHYEEKTTVDEKWTWGVVNVMMIEKINGIAYRRGIGKIIITAWKKLETRREFIVLG